MREALLWQPLKNDMVQCRLCSHFCRIEPAKRGLCGVRENRSGTLYTLVGNQTASTNMDPIEKKPLFHFLPGTSSLSIGAPGCNFSCDFCQNHSLSQPPRENGIIQSHSVTPQSIVDSALASGARSISYTYSEPTIFFELVLDTSRLAALKGLANVLVTNGFQSPECIKELDPVIHAANVDLKSFTENFYRDYCGGRLKPVLENLVRMLDAGWWVEVTTLVIPGLNDSPSELADIARFISEELGPDVPWHVSRFHPGYRMQDRPSTPVRTLEKAWKIGREAGLHYVYTGNVPGHSGEHTLCPECGEIVVERQGFSTTRTNFGKVPGNCDNCETTLAGVGWEELKV